MQSLILIFLMMHLSQGADMVTVSPEDPEEAVRFLIWFRNETTLSVLGQGNTSASVDTRYKISIDPPDAEQNEIYVGESTGPFQAAFNGLIPGRAYNISVETVSEDQISEPTTAQYRTVPWRPHNVTFDPTKIGPNSFEVSWFGPIEDTEFDQYLVAIGIRRKTPQIIERGAPLRAKFTIDLEPGHTYQVWVKTVSGGVASLPAKVNVTTRPLPVLDTIEIDFDELNITLGASISWEPNPDSLQDECKVKVKNFCLRANHSEEYKRQYGHVPYELETCIDNDKNSMEGVYVEQDYLLDRYYFWLKNLQPGENYTISISSVSQGIESVERQVNLAIDTEEVIQLKQEKAAISEEARQLKEENEILKGQLGLSNHQLTKTDENLNRVVELSNRKNYHLKLCEAKVDNAIRILQKKDYNSTQEN